MRQRRESSRCSDCRTRVPGGSGCTLRTSTEDYVVARISPPCPECAPNGVSKSKNPCSAPQSAPSTLKTTLNVRVVSLGYLVAIFVEPDLHQGAGGVTGPLLW